MMAVKLRYIFYLCCHGDAEPAKLVKYDALLGEDELVPDAF